MLAHAHIARRKQTTQSDKNEIYSIWHNTMPYEILSNTFHLSRSHPCVLHIMSPNHHATLSGSILLCLFGFHSVYTQYPYPISSALFFCSFSVRVYMIQNGYAWLPAIPASLLHRDPLLNACVCVRACAFVCVYMHACLRTCLPIDFRTHTHTHTHMHVHTGTCGGTRLARLAACQRWFQVDLRPYS